MYYLHSEQWFSAVFNFEDQYFLNNRLVVSSKNLYLTLPSAAAVLVKAALSPYKTCPS